jgi:hypothetical protein
VPKKEFIGFQNIFQDKMMEFEKRSASMSNAIDEKG